MPDSPGRRAAWRTHVADDNISQYLTSSYEVQTLTVYKTCVLRDSPWDPALVSREFCEPANLSRAGCAFPTKTVGDCKFCLAKRSQSSENKQSYRWRGKGQSVKALAVRELFPCCTRNWVTHKSYRCLLLQPEEIANGKSVWVLQSTYKSSED